MEKTMIELSTGKTYKTENPADAFKIISGSVDVFLVPTENGIQGRPLFLMHCEEGSMIPSVSSKDHNYTDWNLQFEATDDCTLHIVKNGSTKPLKKRFRSRIHLEDKSEKESLEETLREYYLKREIRDDVLITRSEEHRKRERKETENILKQSGEGSVDFEEGRKKDMAPGRMGIGRYMFPLIIFSLMISCCITCAMVDLCHDSGHAMTLFWILMFVVSHWIARTGSGRWAEKEALKIQDAFYEDLYNYNEGSAGEEEGKIMASKAVKGFDMTRSTVEGRLEGVTGLVSAGVILIPLFIMFPAAAAVSAAAISLAGMLIYVSLRTLEMRRSRLRAYGDRVSLILVEIIYRIEKIRLAGALEHMIKRYYEAKRDEKQRSRWVEKRVILGRSAAGIVLGLAMTVIAAFILMGRGYSNNESLACMLGCAAAALEGVMGAAAIAESSGGLGVISSSSAGAEVVNEGGDEAELVAAYDAAPEGAEVIAADEISFGYGEEPVIENVSLSIGKGESLGLVGASGSGKSTLMKLLSGAAAPDSGRIRLLGRSPDDLGKAMDMIASTLMQDDHLLTATIRDNIIMGNGLWDEKDFRQAAEDSGLADELDNFPMGYDTLIREDGENISAGQKQKILIARALMANPRILFMDEAESELRSREQVKLREAVDRRKATVVSVSHNYSTISKCDKIAVLDNGRIVEYGHLEELIEKKGIVYSLMRRQM